MAMALKNEIRMLVRQSVQETVEAEMARIRATLLPLVAKKEQRDIETRYKKPSRQFIKTLCVELC